MGGGCDDRRCRIAAGRVVRDACALSGPDGRGHLPGGAGAARGAVLGRPGAAPVRGAGGAAGCAALPRRHRGPPRGRAAAADGFPPRYRRARRHRPDRHRRHDRLRTGPAPGRRPRHRCGRCHRLARSAPGGGTARDRPPPRGHLEALRHRPRRPARRAPAGHGPADAGGEDRPHGRRPGTRYRSPHRHPTPPARLSGRSPPLPPRRPRRRRCPCGSARSGRAAGCRAALPRAGCPRPHAHVVVRRRTEVGEDAPSDRAVRARGRSASARLPGDGRGGAPAGPADRTRAARRGPGRRRPGRRAAQPRCRAAGASGGGVGRRPDPEAIRAGRDRPGRHLGPTPR